MLNSLTLDNVLLALADETRRRIMARLAEGEARVTEVAAPFPISLNSVSKHIRILERAGLVQRRCSGRDHYLRLNPQPLQEATEWMRSRQVMWSGSLDRLAAVLDQQTRYKGEHSHD